MPRFETQPSRIVAATQASSLGPERPGPSAVARATADADRALRRYLWREVLAFSEHYRKAFPAAGLDPRRVRGLADLRPLPPVTRADLARSPEEFQLRPTPARLREHWGFARKLGLVTGGRRAWRGLVQAYTPVLELTGLDAGDDGAPSLRVATTGSDLERMAADGARRLTELGLAPGAALVTDDEPRASLTHWWTTLSAVRAACRLVPACGDPLAACARSGAKALWASVERTRALARRAREEATDLRALELVLAHGPGLDDEARREVADGFAAAGATVRVVGAYVSTATRTVLLETLDEDAAPGFAVPLDRLAVEALDPASGAPLPPESPGELVLTPLDGRGTAVVRFRTGDLLDRGLSWRACPRTGAARPWLSRISPTSPATPPSDRGTAPT